MKSQHVHDSGFHQAPVLKEIRPEKFMSKAAALDYLVKQANPNKALRKIIEQMKTSPGKPSLDKDMVKQLKAIHGSNRGTPTDNIIAKLSGPNHKGEIHNFLKSVYAN